MKRRPPRTTRTDTLVPDTTHCRSLCCLTSRTPDIQNLTRTSKTRGVDPCPSTEFKAFTAAQPRYGAKAEAQVAQQLEWARGRGKEREIVYWEAVLGQLTKQPHEHRGLRHRPMHRSEEHTSELQSLMRTSYAVFCLK